MLKLHLSNQHKVTSKPIHPHMSLLVALFILAVASANALLFPAVTSATADSYCSWQHPAQFVRQTLLAKVAVHGLLVALATLSSEG